MLDGPYGLKQLAEIPEKPASEMISGGLFCGYNTAIPWELPEVTTVAKASSLTHRIRHRRNLRQLPHSEPNRGEQKTRR